LGRQRGWVRKKAELPENTEMRKAYSRKNSLSQSPRRAEDGRRRTEFGENQQWDDLDGEGEGKKART